jgi:Transcription factor WhiB
VRLFDSPLGDREWAVEASCAYLVTPDYDPWHPDLKDGPAIAYAVARRICLECPVRLECLHEGLALLEVTTVQGMWGGMTPPELRELAREAGRPARKVAAHGTRARYVPPHNCRCPECRKSNASEEHQRRLTGDYVPSRTATDDGQISA